MSHMTSPCKIYYYCLTVIYDLSLLFNDFLMQYFRVNFKVKCNDLELAKWLKEHLSALHGSPVSAWTQSQLCYGGCSGQTPREGLVPSRCGWIDPHHCRMLVVEPRWRPPHPPPVYRQLLSSSDSSGPYDNRESRHNDAETSVFWRRPKESGRKLILPDICWC